MPIVALTGGIAAGKSAVTSVLQELGALVIDADILARRVVEPGSPALEEIARRFGPGVLTTAGELDRGALGSIVFSDPNARESLENIVHPVVQRLSREAFAEAERENPGRVLVYAIPLLAESKRPSEFDLVVVVHASAKERADRLVQYRGFTAEEAQRRVSAQASDAERLALADVVLDSSGDLDKTVTRAQWLFQALKECWPDRLSEAPARYAALAS